MTGTLTRTPREHPDVERVPKMSDTALWRYVLDELDFLSTPEQKRVPVSVSAAIHELHVRSRARR